MPILTDFQSDLEPAAVYRNMLGPRGIEAMRNTVGGVTRTQFPLYDGHGNLKALLKRESRGTFSTSWWRQYEVWGGFLDSGSNLDESAYGHCANLGHPSDPLTGAIYMRARYYEPWTGRFISEDPARDGLNWFGYCGNDPVNKVDITGQNGLQEQLVVQSEMQGLGRYLFDRMALGVYKHIVGISNRLTVEVGWLTTFGGTATAASVKEFVAGLEKFARGQGCSEIFFKFTSMTSGGKVFIEKLMEEVGAEITTNNGINHILWTIRAIEGF